MPKAKAVAPEAPAVDPADEPVIDQKPEQVGEPDAPVDDIVEQLDAPTAEQSDAAPEAPAVVKARVLSACAYGQPDDIVELTAAEAKALEGVVDADPAAVAYAESLK